MALGTTNTNLTQIAVKRLSGKAMTNSNLSIPEEGFGSTVQTAALTVFGEVLPNNPATGSENLFLIQSQSNSHPGTVMLVDFDITPINDSQYQNVIASGETNVLNYTGDQGQTNENTFHAYVLSLTGSFAERITDLGATYFASNASTPVTLGNAPFTSSFTTTGSVQLQIVPEFVSTINGSTNPYIPQISKKQSPETFEGASALSANNGTADIDYYLDPFSGILFIQDPVDFSGGSGNVPGKVRAFIYVGKYQTDVVSGDTVNLHISASEGTGFSIANNATASFESGSLGVTITAGSTNKITIGDSGDQLKLVSDNTSTGSIFFEGGDTDNIFSTFNDSAGGTPQQFVLKHNLGDTEFINRRGDLILSASSGNNIGIQSHPALGAALTVGGTISSSGDIITQGDVIARNYIVSSSVTYMTQSFSDGSTIFGNTLDDTHRFTGSLFVTGNVSISSGSLIVAAQHSDSSFTNEGIIFQSNIITDNDNRIRVTTAENMQFNAAASFQFKPRDGQVVILDNRQLQFNTENNASKARIVATSGSVTDQVRLDIENDANVPKVSIITSGSSDLEGNVGIGTTTPEKGLTIKDAEALITGSSTKRLEIRASGQGNVEAGLRLAAYRTSAGNVGTSTLFKTGSNTILSLDEDITIRNNQRTSFVINGAGDINFVSSSDTTNATLTSYLFGDNENKRIGIGGITTPAHELDITGSARIKGPFSQLRLLNDNNSDNIEIGVSGGGDAFMKRGDNNGLIRFRDVDNVDVMTIAFSPTTHNKKVIISGSISASMSASIGAGDRLNLYSDATNSTIDTVNNRLRFRTYRTQDYIEFKPNNSIELIISDSGSKFSSNITASSDISSSGNLFASLSLDSTTGFKTVMYDTATGQFFHTGSYGGGGGGSTITTDMATAISGAINAATASLSASIIGTANEVEVTSTETTIVVGLPDDVTIAGNLNVNGSTLATDDTTFNLLDTTATTINFGGAATTIDIGAAGNSNVNIKGSASIDGDLVVRGEVTSINTTELNVEDPFILLNSGSTTGDGGIIVQTAANGIGTALFFDDSSNRWAFAQSGSTAYSATTPTAQQYVVSVSSSAANPTGVPSNFGNSSTTQVGMMYIATTDNDNDKNNIWIYA